MIQTFAGRAVRCSIARAVLVVLAAAAIMALPAQAQRLGPPVKRPALRDVTDTNDAHAYFNLGLERFELNADEASAAFYWAARINPAWGEPIYARRAALIMSDRGLLKNVMEGTRRTLESPEMRRLDSLQLRALFASPFLYRQLDRPMFLTYFKESVKRDIRSRGGNDQAGDLDYAIDGYLRTSGEYTRGWMAYGAGDFTSALTHYALAVGAARDKASIRIERARILAMQGQAASAIAEFKLALDEMRTKDQKDLVVFYNSKALAEYSIGVLQEGAGDAAAARESYGRALTEDLAYYPAHTRLGLLALGTHDTATAISELALSAQLAPDEPHVHYLNGFVLAHSNRAADGVTALKKAVELEPYYALPYLLLGQVYEQLGKGPEALAAYQGFLARASAGDGQRAYAMERAGELKEILAVGKP